MGLRARTTFVASKLALPRGAIEPQLHWSVAAVALQYMLIFTSTSP